MSLPFFVSLIFILIERDSRNECEIYKRTCSNGFRIQTQVASRRTKPIWYSLPGELPGLALKLAAVVSVRVNGKSKG